MLPKTTVFYEEFYLLTVVVTEVILRTFDMHLFRGIRKRLQHCIGSICPVESSRGLICSTCCHVSTFLTSTMFCPRPSRTRMCFYLSLQIYTRISFAQLAWKQSHHLARYLLNKTGQNMAEIRLEHANRRPECYFQSLKARGCATKSK